MGQQRLTAGEVEAATRHLPGGAAPARLLEEKDRNQVFAVGEQAIFNAYLAGRRQAGTQDRHTGVPGPCMSV